MLDDNDMYVIVKLTSGEQMMAVLKDEDEDYVMLDTPMSIRIIPVIEAGKEHVTAQPLCHFTDDQSFVISKRNILFVKKLHHVFISHYQKIVEEHSKTSFIARKQKSADDLKWEDENEEYLTERDEEEIRKKLDLLREVFGRENEEEEPEIRTYVQGNDTKH
jgi:hypothetical protein